MDRKTQTSSPETLELIRAAQQGCSVAFDCLARQFEPLVFSIARRKLGNHHDAEDETQNALVEAFQHLDSLQDPAKFASWLKRLVRNRCIDRVRRKVHVESCVEYREDVSLAAPSTTRALPAAPEIAGAVARLSPPLRETLELHYFQNCSLKEISARLNVPLNTVKRRLHDARQKLRSVAIEKDFSTKSALAPNLLPSPFDVSSEEDEQSKSTEPA